MNDHELLALYDQRRACSRALHAELVAACGKEVTMTAGRRLGILQKGIFVFDSEEESAVLFDAAIHAVRDVKGESVVQRMARSGRYPQESPEQRALDAMSRARYSLFTLHAGSPGVWVSATDVMNGHVSRIVDRGLSSSPPPMIASRLVDYPEFSMTTGAAMPIDTREEFEVLAEALDQRGISPEVLRASHTTTTRRDDFYFVTTATQLRAGLLRRTKFVDPTNPDELAALDEGDPLDPDVFRGPQLPVRRDGPKIGRNDPCPCGSGKKFKKCHGG